MRGLVRRRALQEWAGAGGRNKQTVTNPRSSCGSTATATVCSRTDSISQVPPCEQHSHSFLNFLARAYIQLSSLLSMHYKLLTQLPPGSGWHRHSPVHDKFSTDSFTAAHRAAHVVKTKVAQPGCSGSSVRMVTERQ